MFWVLGIYSCLLFLLEMGLVRVELGFMVGGDEFIYLFLVGEMGKLYIIQNQIDTYNLFICVFM